MEKLINLLDLKAIRPLSEDIPEERINPYIIESQRVDLFSFLGNNLYTSFLQGTTVFPFSDLLSGSEFTVNGQTYSHEGVKVFLAYTTLIKFYRNNKINISKFGIVAKLNDQSEHITVAEINLAIEDLEAGLLSVKSRILFFINNTEELSNLFGASETITSSIKFFDI